MNITLALGGGGAKGNSHIGVIRSLQKEGFKIQAVAGTSYGGIVAAFFALGYPPDEIETLFAPLEPKKMYGHSDSEGPSLLGLAGLTQWLNEAIGERTFNDLQIPCILTAADLRSGGEYLLMEGSLVDAILATVAVPGIFPPKRIGERELVDGGTLDPVPVAAARSLAPRLPVVAVSLSTPMGVPAQPWNIPLPSYVPQMIVDRLSRLRFTQAVEISMRSIDIASRALTEYRLEVDKPDVIIHPRVEDIDMLEYVDVHEIAQRGEAATQAVMPELKKLFAWHTRLRRSLGV